MGYHETLERILQMGNVELNKLSAIRASLPSSAGATAMRPSDAPQAIVAEGERQPSRDRLIRQAVTMLGASEESLVHKVQGAKAQEAEEEQRKIAEAAAKGAKIGGSLGGGVGSAIIIRQGLKRPEGIPLSAFGKAFSVVGAGFSGYGIGTNALRIANDLRASTIEVRPLIQHGLNLAGNTVVLAGTLSMATGAGAGPGLIAIGVGTLITAGSDLLSP